ncbi:hypothetical protein FIE12Z_5250 [Fusarium flagelliforme]|uniref:Uncharacterized protein n=1 Tax=Fusarium flagelliforme TaxID=2675880 RepID=A0A395MS19_9HYPO|nr:hypothetical protein FIE12Z_5250 [Fusarium flagelliforme]
MGTQPISNVTIFSPGFSKLLSSLIVQPAWDCNYRKLRMALQFAVICRIESGERGPSSRDRFNHTSDCHALELLRVRFDELEPGSVSEKLRQAIALTLFKEEFPAFLLTISQYISQETTDGDINPSYRGFLAYPVATRDLKSIEQALGNYAWANAAWRIRTQRMWEAFQVKRGNGWTEFPKHIQIKEYIPLAVRHIYAYLARTGVSHTPSRDVNAEGTDESPLASQDIGPDWHSSGGHLIISHKMHLTEYIEEEIGRPNHGRATPVFFRRISSGGHDEEPPAQDHSPLLGAVPSGAPDTVDDSSDDGVLPTMSGAINSSSRQGSADSRALSQLKARHHELRTSDSELRAIVKSLQERVQALERLREVDPPSTAALIAENERLRRQHNALKALARRQVREIQVLRQQRP